MKKTSASNEAAFSGVQPRMYLPTKKSKKNLTLTLVASLSP